MAATGRAARAPNASAAEGLVFYMYEDRALDHGWLRHCPGFDQLTSSPYNERLAEVYTRDELASHPHRTRDASAASLFYVPLWVEASFLIGRCNGTTHTRRMQRALGALSASPWFRRGSGARLGNGYPGTNHMFVNTGCMENGTRLGERLGKPLWYLLRGAIVGRDRAYSPLYRASGVGRCTLEVPYVSNPHALGARRAAIRAALAARNASREERRGQHRSGSGTGPAASDPGAAVAEPLRPHLLTFIGSLDVCCQPGKAIRKAMRQLVGAAQDTLIVHKPRHANRTKWPQWPGRTPEEQRNLYRSAGELQATSRFCLVPAGDNEVSSRLYSSIAAGCIPVVVANQLSGAFASLVPYHRFWLRVDENTFISSPRALLPRLRAIAPAEVAARRARMLRHVADVIYTRSHGGSPRAHRLGSNLLRAASDGCLRGAATPTLGIYPHTHPYAADDKWGLNCSCLRAPPHFFWGPAAHGAGAAAAAAARASKLWTRGKVPTDVCRCLHCATLCPA